jgi:hypothetical protein
LHRGGRTISKQQARQGRDSKGEINGERTGDGKQNVAGEQKKMKGWIQLVLLMFSGTVAAQDLSGTYDVGTLTPLERPEQFGNSLFLSPEQAEAMTARIAGMKAADLNTSRKALEATSYVSAGYNFFWLDVGTTPNLVDGKFRTSIITSPENGRKPAMTPDGAARMQAFFDAWQIVWRNPDPTVGLDGGRAWWLDEADGIGPYDHLEQRPLAERCIIGSRSTAGPPMLPNVYNNIKRIIQTEQAVMILTEMIHDARIVRLNVEHRPQHIRTWLGDSIGWWEGETLVIDTTNFNATPALSGADENLQVIERLTRRDDGSILYQFEIKDPTVWETPWGGEYLWGAVDEKIYEFACHEGNYALGNIMRGARQLEADALTVPAQNQAGAGG